MSLRSPNSPISASSPRPPGDFPTMTQFATLCIWVLFTAVGVIGIAWPIPSVHAQDSAPAATPVTIDVTTAAPADSEASPEPSTPLPAPPDPQPALPPAPPAVAAPSPQIPFAIPVPNVARIVASALASPVAPVAPAVHPAVAPRQEAPPAAPYRIALGQGEGKYIQLAYPEEAQLAGEEGTVEVQFTQDNAGHVSDARVITPSRWPILNAAALRAVRQTVFPPGQADTHVITFVFKLQ